ncbi:MAG: hypothetical protein H7Y13_02145 [Sphingobacteriaceae bacterium]|nr:hypothetical protein [Sphingobacteriaceae bacterium]
MEDFLPFLGGLAYMAYKFYTNYQKGQEEARNRNPSQPYQETEPETYREWGQPEPVYVPEPVKKYEPVPEKYHEPKYEPAYREPRKEKPVRETLYREPVSKIPRKVELSNPEVPAEEIVKNRAIHEPHKHKFEASQEVTDYYSDFDFKDAIVKEAILNRPQY